MEMEQMNIYKKLQKAREMILESGLKKSGYNKFSNYSYYELGDFLPTTTKVFGNLGLTALFTIEGDAELKIVNNDTPTEDVTFRSPLPASMEIKGQTAIQTLGATHTYMKRYLYLNALEMVEPDMVDRDNNKDGSKGASTTSSAPKQAAPEAPAAQKAQVAPAAPAAPAAPDLPVAQDLPAAQDLPVATNSNLLERIEKDFNERIKSAVKSVHKEGIRAVVETAESLEDINEVINGIQLTEKEKREMHRRATANHNAKYDPMLKKYVIPELEIEVRRNELLRKLDQVTDFQQDNP
jgi:hypothetical protein